MITGKHVRHQLINMLNKQYLTSYHYVDFKRIQQHLYKKYGLLHTLSVWVLPSLNHPTACQAETWHDGLLSPFLKFGEITWAQLENHGFHSRLLKDDLFHDEYEILWSFIFALQTSTIDIHTSHRI